MSSLVKSIMDQTGLSETIVEKVVDTLFSEIRNNTYLGRRTTIRHFGSFFPKVVQAKAGVNPHTGDRMQIPQRTKPSFKAAHSFRKFFQ